MTLTTLTVPHDSAVGALGMPTAVYQAYDAQGALLYVGISEDWARRWIGHHWERPTLFAAVARLEIAWYPTRAAAEAQERRVIAAQQPPHNRAGIERTAKPPLSLRWYLDVPRLARRDPQLACTPEYSIGRIAADLGIAPKTIRNLLSTFKREFPRATYGRNAADHRIRLLSEADVSKLVELLAYWAVAERRPAVKP